MGLAHSPKIVTDGLVFAYDMGNPQKSWKGAPTTNLANVGLNGMSGITLSFLGIEDGWKKYSMNGTFTGGTYPYIMNISSVAFTGGVTYSSVCYVKTNVENKFNYFGTGMNYVNVPMNKGGTNIGSRQSDNSFYCGRIDFEYTSNTTQPGYILSNPINNTSFSSSTDFVWIKEGQIEQQPFPTPFAGDAGTRSNTQAILDWTGNNTITANSLTYNADGTFEFNGTTDFLDTNQTFKFDQTGQFSVDFWINFISHSDRATAAAGIVGKGHFYNNGWDIWLYNSHQIAFETSGDPTRQGSNYLNTASLALNTWHYYSATYNNGLKSNYVNGNLIGTQTYSGPGNFTNNNNVLIGRRFGDSSRSLRGSLSAVKIYNRALTAAEVAQNFAALRGRYGI
jgi:hypothetical protein